MPISNLLAERTVEWIDSEWRPQRENIIEFLNLQREIGLALRDNKNWDRGGKLIRVSSTDNTFLVYGKRGNLARQQPVKNFLVCSRHGQARSLAHSI